MKTIKFFHKEGTFNYYIEKCLCKVVYAHDQHLLLIEVHSTDDLEHVDEDSIQNDFPQVVLSIDDFPVSFQSLEELENQVIDIPSSFVELENDDGEIEEFFYTNVNFSVEDFEADDNELQFYKDETGVLGVKWRGRVQDFIQDSEEYIPFEVDCIFTSPKLEIVD